MKKILLCIPFVLLLCAWSCKVGGKSDSVELKESKIFLVNLFDENIDVRLGEEDVYVFKMDNLEPYTASKLIRSKDYGSYRLYFKKSTDSEYYFWADDDGDPVGCDILEGKIQCIVLQSNGMVDYYLLDDTDEAGARIAFFNGTDEIMKRMEVGTDYEMGTAAYTDELSGQAMTDFAVVEPGDYGLFWESASQGEGEYYYFPDETGEALEKWPLKDKGYYFFISYYDEFENMPLAYLFDITP